jgi:hypothetical protein
MATATAVPKVGAAAMTTRPHAAQTTTATITGIRLHSRSESRPTAIPTTGDARDVRVNNPSVTSSTSRVCTRNSETSGRKAEIEMPESTTSRSRDRYSG